MWYPVDRNQTRRGDMYIKIKVQIPTHLGFKAKSVMKDLAKALGEETSPKPIAFDN